VPLHDTSTPYLPAVPSRALKLSARISPVVRQPVRPGPLTSGEYSPGAVADRCPVNTSTPHILSSPASHWVCLFRSLGHQPFHATGYPHQHCPRSPIAYFAVISVKMLAAHRDQENLVHSHQGQSKQLPKTPGARNPKTPFKAGQRDENAPIAFGGKSVLRDGRKGVENEPIFTIGKTGRQALVTPSGTSIGMTTHIQHCPF
jgi:hypothetical protein